MTKEIKSAIGGAMNDDTEKLIAVFNSNFETIDSNFNKLRESLEETIAKAKEDQIKYFN
jgi:hypothetical protein